MRAPRKNRLPPSNEERFQSSFDGPPEHPIGKADEIAPEKSIGIDAHEPLRLPFRIRRLFVTRLLDINPFVTRFLSKSDTQGSLCSTNEK